MATTTTLMTAEELLALPEDGIDRELINGQLREYPAILHGPPHGRAMSNLSYLLGAWLRQQPRPRGRLYASGLGVHLRWNPDTFVSVDLVYISPEMAARTSDDMMFLDIPPMLAVVILAPSYTTGEIAEKVHAYLGGGGAPLVWEVNPYYQTVLAHRPDAPPQLFNSEQELTAEPHLPGFRVPVAEIFAA